MKVEFQDAINTKRRKNNRNSSPEEMEAEYKNPSANKSVNTPDGDSDAAIKDGALFSVTENQEIIEEEKKQNATLLCKL